MYRRSYIIWSPVIVCNSLWTAAAVIVLVDRACGSTKVDTYHTERGVFRGGRMTLRNLTVTATPLLMVLQFGARVTMVD